MDEEKTAKRIGEGGLTAVEIGRPRLSWEGDVTEDLVLIKIQDWSKVAKDTETWKKTVEQAKTQKGLQHQQNENNGTEWNIALNCCTSTPCGRHMQLFLCQFSLCFI